MKNQIKLKDFLDFKSINQIKASPSQDKFAFVLSTLNEKENRNDHVIYVSQNNTYKQMSALNKESSYVWEDDTNLLFLAKRFKEEEDNQDKSYIYRLPLDGGEARLAYEINIGINQFWVIDQNTLLLSSSFHVDHPNFYQYSKTKRDKLANEKKDNDAFKILSQIPFWSNGTQIIDGLKTRLFFYHIKQQKLEPLTSGSMNVSDVTINKEKDKIYYLAQTYKTRRPFKDKLYVYDVVTHETTALISTNKYAIYAIMPLKDELLVFASDNKRLGLNQNPALYQLQAANQLRLIQDDISLGNSLGTDVRLGSNAPIVVQDDYFVFNTTVDGHSELLKYEDEKISTLFNHEGSVDGFVCLKDKLIVMGLFHMKLQEFYDEKLNQLSHFNDSQNDKNIIHPQKIVFHSNHDEISGWVLLPDDYDSQKEVSAILDIHGGPKTAYGPLYTHEMQVWANMGYLVMYCNPHGSSGKGDAFSDIRGKYGTIDYEDIMTFVDVVLEKFDKINPKNIGVTGGSYGGFMTNWIIGHTNRFKCAVTQRSISNWTSFYGVSDIGYYFTEDQNNASIYSEVGQSKLWWHSPLKYAANFSTPTLVIHSTDDYRCPIDQGYQLYSALVDRQVEAKMLVVKNENHDLSRSGRPKARVKRLTEMTNWFKKHL